MIKQLFSGFHLSPSHEAPTALETPPASNEEQSHQDSLRIDNNNYDVKSDEIPKTAQRRRKQGHYVHRINNWISDERQNDRNDESTTTFEPTANSTTVSRDIESAMM